MTEVALPAKGDAALAAICQRFRVQQLDLFGSVVGDGFDPARSDLDFLVQFEPLEPASYADAYFGLLEALGALYGRPVDLATEAALENPYFRRRVQTERRTVFEAA
jgi:hypothetical protein